MATNVVTAPEIDCENHTRPVTWDEWIKLLIREQDRSSGAGVFSFSGRVSKPLTAPAESAVFPPLRPGRFEVCALRQLTAQNRLTAPSDRSLIGL